MGENGGLFLLISPVRVKSNSCSYAAHARVMEVILSCKGHSRPCCAWSRRSEKSLYPLGHDEVNNISPASSFLLVYREACPKINQVHSKVSSLGEQVWFGLDEPAVKDC